MSKTSNNGTDDNKPGNVKAPSGKANGVNRVVIIGAAAAVVIIAALVVVIVGLMNKKPEPAAVPSSTSGGRGTVVTSENASQVLEDIGKPVEDGYYETSMNIDWVFETSKTPSKNAYVGNAETNTRTVYIDVTLQDTGELVYSSPFIPVGAELTNFALDADLKAGTYPAVATYHLVDEDENELSTVSVSVTLHIEK